LNCNLFLKVLTGTDCLSAGNIMFFEFKQGSILKRFIYCAKFIPAFCFAPLTVRVYDSFLLLSLLFLAREANIPSTQRPENIINPVLMPARSPG